MSVSVFHTDRRNERSHYSANFGGVIKQHQQLECYLTVASLAVTQLYGSSDRQSTYITAQRINSRTSENYVVFKDYGRLELKNQTTSFATKHQHRQCIYDALLLLLKYLARIFRRFLFSLRILFFLHYKVCTLYKVSKLGSTLQVWVSYKIHSCENYSNIQGSFHIKSTHFGTKSDINISNLVENWHTYSY